MSLIQNDPLSDGLRDFGETGANALFIEKSCKAAPSFVTGVLKPDEVLKLRFAMNPLLIDSIRAESSLDFSSNMVLGDGIEVRRRVDDRNDDDGKSLFRLLNPSVEVLARFVSSSRWIEENDEVLVENSLSVS